MKEFLKELETELIKLEKNTKPITESGILSTVKDLANKGRSLGELESNMRDVTDKLLIKHNITKSSDELSESVESLFIKVANNRL